MNENVNRPDYHFDKMTYTKSGKWYCENGHYNSKDIFPKEDIASGSWLTEDDTGIKYVYFEDVDLWVKNDYCNLFETKAIETDTQEKIQNNYNSSEKPEVGKSILFAIIGIVAFYTCLYILGLGLSFLFAFLFKIPVVSQWLSLIFQYRGDSPTVIVRLGSIILSFWAVRWMIRRFCSIQATKKLSLIICGAILFGLNVFFLVGNIIEGGEIGVNILIMIFALIMIGTSGS